MSRIRLLYLKQEFYQYLNFIWEVKKKLVNFKYYNELDRTIGIHYRNIDETYDTEDIKACNKLNFIKNSPINEFEMIIDSLKNISNYTHLLVVSNSIDTIDKLRQKFRNKHFIQYTVSNFDRNSTEGMLDTIVEWLLLAKTQLIIGTYYSSFSDEATFLNFIPKITPLNINLRQNIKDTVNSYHCLNYSFNLGMFFLGQENL